MSWLNLRRSRQGMLVLSFEREGDELKVLRESFILLESGDMSELFAENRIVEVDI